MIFLKKGNRGVGNDDLVVPLFHPPNHKNFPSPVRKYDDPRSK